MRPSSLLHVWSTCRLPSRMPGAKVTERRGTVAPQGSSRLRGEEGGREGDRVASIHRGVHSPTSSPRECLVSGCSVPSSCAGTEDVGRVLGKADPETKFSSTHPYKCADFSLSQSLGKNNSNGSSCLWRAAYTPGTLLFRVTRKHTCLPGSHLPPRVPASMLEDLGA